MHKRSAISLFISMALTILGLSTFGLCADEPAPPTNGTVTGIVTAKGDNGISVKADGDKEAVRYIPFWRGGLPKDGGGPDKATIEALKKVLVANRVKIVWELQEKSRRIVSIEVLAPAEKSGVTEGVIVAKETGWIDVKAAGDAGVTERYSARWIGGMPNDGGGLDKTVLAAIAACKVGDHVRISWSYDERLRIVQMQVTPAETK